MGSKPIIFLYLSLAIFLITIASEVAARDVADTTASATSLADYSAREADNKNEVKDAKYPGNGYGGGRRGGYLRGRYGGGYGRYCPYGCCRRSFYRGGCKMCCPYKGEAAAMDDEPPRSSSKNP